MASNIYWPRFLATLYSTFIAIGAYVANYRGEVIIRVIKVRIPYLFSN